jgi:hypothetical protein
MGSLCASLRRLQELRGVFKKLVDDGALEPHKNLTNEEWLAVEACLAVLEPFSALQSILEGDQYPTSSLLLGLITDLRDSLHHLVQQTSPNAFGLYGHPTYMLIHQPLVDVVKDFEDRWGDGKDVTVERLGTNNRPFGIAKVREAVASSFLLIFCRQSSLTLGDQI